MTEEWRSVLSDRYEVSNLGRVRRKKSGRMLKLCTASGYPVFTACVNAVRKNVHVHVLVAEAFLGPRPPGKHINHIDGVKTNNRPKNLEYVTPAENCAHSGRMGLAASGLRHGRYTKPERTARGERHHKAILTEEDVRELRRLRASGLTYSALEKMFGLARGSARDADKRAWRHIK
jgi:hypothetical protein